MPSLDALSLAPDADRWLEGSRQLHVLHVFERVCNLINEHADVLSIVTPQIGNGPFNLVLGEEICFPDYLDLESPISVDKT